VKKAAFLAVFTEVNFKDTKRGASSGQPNVHKNELKLALARMKQSLETLRTYL
jgi:hypothetical protein